MRTIAGLVFVLAAMLCGTQLVGVQRTAAQEATPAAGLGSPDPVECTVEPRPLAFFDRYFGTPTAAQEAAMMAAATPFAGFTMPAGEPADEATVATVVATVRQLGACINAGDFFGGFAALFTDDYLQREFERTGPLPKEERSFIYASPVPLPADSRAALLAVVDVRVLPDGRVAALFDLVDPFSAPPGPARFYWELVDVDGRWLIDEQIMLGPITPDQIGIPTP